MPTLASDRRPDEKEAERQIGIEELEDVRESGVEAAAEVNIV
jgi:hypothetical protein